MRFDEIALHVGEGHSRTHCNAVLRLLRNAYRNLRLILDSLIDAIHQRTAAGDHDTGITDVSGHLRRRSLQYRVYRLADNGERFLSASYTLQK